jgi:hypothetical protein
MPVTALVGLLAAFESIDAGTLRPQTALLEIQCVPSSSVLVDGKVVGTTRFPFFTNFEVAPGKHKVACEARKGRHEEEVTVAPRETKVLRFRVE